MKQIQIITIVVAIIFSVSAVEEMTFNATRIEKFLFPLAYSQYMAGGFQGKCNEPIIVGSCAKWTGFQQSFQIDFGLYNQSDYQIKGNQVELCWEKVTSQLWPNITSSLWITSALRNIKWPDEPEQIEPPYTEYEIYYADGFVYNYSSGNNKSICIKGDFESLLWRFENQTRFNLTLSTLFNQSLEQNCQENITINITGPITIKFKLEGNHTYNPIHSQTFNIPYDDSTKSFPELPITKSADYLQMSMICSLIGGFRLQFKVDEFEQLGKGSKMNNSSLCVWRYQQYGWLDSHEVYVTDVLSKSNYSWPKNGGDEIQPNTSIYDIYNSTNGFSAKLTYKAGTYDQKLFQYVDKYCLEGKEFEKFLKITQNDTVGITILIDNIFNCYWGYYMPIMFCDANRCEARHQPVLNLGNHSSNKTQSYFVDS